MAIFAPEITLHFYTLPPSLCLLIFFIRLEEKLKKKKNIVIFSKHNTFNKKEAIMHVCVASMHVCVAREGKSWGYLKSELYKSRPRTLAAMELFDRKLLLYQCEGEDHRRG